MKAGSTMKAVTERQVLGAKIRAEKEKYEAKVRRRVSGGWEFAKGHRERLYAHLAKKFGMDPNDVQYFLTWSRSCDHPWSAGACPMCPD